MNDLTDEQYQLIDRFFRNELKKEELPSFEDQMKTAAFKSTVKMQYSLRNALKEEHERDPLMQLFKREAQQYKRTTGASQLTTIFNQISQLFKLPLSNSPRFAYAASACILIVMSNFWWANTNYSNTAIASNYSSPLLDDQQAGPPTTKELFNDAKEAYFAGNYERAIILFEQITTNDKYYPEAQVLLAYTYLQSNEYEKSILLFDAALNTHFDALPSWYQNENKLRWNRLLAHVGAGKITTSFFQGELNFFLNNKSDIYRKKAQDLNEKLNSWWRHLTF